MKNPLLDWVLLIPWRISAARWTMNFFMCFLLLTFNSAGAFENRFKSRGASLSQKIQPSVITRTLIPATYYYYDTVAAPVSVRQRRQRQFGADQVSPVVVLQTGRDTPATVQIKELPPLVRPRQPQQSGFFVQSPPPTTAATTSFARFNQFGQNLFTLSPVQSAASNGVGVSSQSASAIPPPPPVPNESRFSPPVQLTSLNNNKPEPFIGRLPTSVPTLAASTTTQETSRTLFSGFTSRSTTPSTSSTFSSTLPTLATSTLSQRPFASTTRFLRPSRLTTGTSSSVFQRSTTTKSTLATTDSLIEFDIDPCIDQNHIVIANEPERSANHHLSLGAGSPICDRTILAGWYRFDSPAGNLIPTECPGENYCGTRKPVWLNGTHPSVADGIVPAIGCVVESSEECCGVQLDLAIKNCSNFMVYHLVPPKACSVGYCAGHRLPCPEGLTSPSGFTPCEFPVKLREVHLKPNKVTTAKDASEALLNNNNEEIVFYCFPMLDGIVDPHTVVIDVEWWVEDKLVIEESFNLKARSSGILQPQFWKMGQTVRCSVRARHGTIGTKTEKIFSPRFFAGIQMTSPSVVRIHPGEQIEEIRFHSTVAPMCTLVHSRFVKPTSPEKCCLDIEFDLKTTDEEVCSKQGLAINLPTCQMQLCNDNWNQTLVIPLASSGKNDQPNDEIEYTLTPFVRSSHKQWTDYKLPAIKIILAPSTVEKYQSCSLSASNSLLEPFDQSLQYNMTLDGPAKTMAIYTLYRKTTGGSDIEVQVQMRRCNLRPHCLCAVAVRSKTMAVYFDRCTKGFLQVWAKESLKDVHVHGIDVMSRLEGRIYEVRLPDGSILTVDPLLTQVKIISKQSQVGKTQGLCQSDQCQNGHCLFTTWRVKPVQSLFNGVVKMSANMSGDAETSKQCLLLPDSEEACSKQTLLLEEAKSSRSILTDLLQLGANEDLSPYTRLAVEEENELEEIDANDNAAAVEMSNSTQLLKATTTPKIRPPSLSEISFSDGPSKEPEEGWTLNAASSFCFDYISSTHASKSCGKYVRTSRYIDSCQSDLLFSGNSRVASLHLKNLKEDCRQVIETDKSLSMPILEKEDILDSLCLSSCSGHGTCHQGFCSCDLSYGGADCSLDLRQGPHVTALNNLGLCDVRTKPCRDVIVVAEQLATKSAEDELKCIIEIYKIRGVASKQLVNDAVVSVSGRPLSYEQVLCRLPRLDIHELSSDDFNTNFDLKDNTDHTQLLVKISLEYSQNGGRSAPLDLLLYDSLCWDCSIDGCQANTKENKCFFASGTSALQIFRIGRTIATRVSPDDAYTCTLPKDSGSCDNKIFRYYYNAIERRCKLFVYGGCKGNGNNFVSEVQCLQKCGDESDLALLPQVEITTEIDICSQKRDSGICPGNVPRFYFAKTLGRCQLFSYGGCGGNSNNFETLDQCVAHCGGPKEDVFQISTLTGSLKPRKSHCNLPVSKGNCQAKLRRFYFDTEEGSCKLFIFGGCTGNANNFETMEECILNCSGPDLGQIEEEVLQTPTPFESFSSRLQRFKSNFNERNRGSSSFAKPTFQVTTTTTTEATTAVSLFTSSSSSPSRSSVCSLPKHFGTCLTDSIRFYHDPSTNSCRKFRYSGCGGNGNNFLSGEECVRTCGGLLDVSVSGPPPPTVIKNTLFPKPSLFTTTTISTTTTTTTTTTSTTTTTTTTSTTTPSTTTTEAIETQNEVIRGRRVIDSEQVNRNRVKIRVRHKKRPFTTAPTTTPTTTTTASTAGPTFPTRTLIRRLRPSLEEIEVRTEKSVRTATSKSVIMQTNNALFAKRNGLLFNETVNSNNRNVAHPRSNLPREAAGNKPVVVLRSFCRKPPMESENPHCFRPEPLYFYNVTSASCEPFYKGHCARSRNKFNTVQECLEKCTVTSSLSSSETPNVGSTLSSSTSTTTQRPLLPASFFARPRGLFSRRRTGRRIY